MLHLPTDLQQAIAHFERLQIEYADLGAEDTEPDAEFHRVIVCGCNHQPVDWARVDWQLFDPSTREQEVQLEGARFQLSRAARKVYELVLLYAHDATICEKLRTYAWRITNLE